MKQKEQPKPTDAQPKAVVLVPESIEATKSTRVAAITTVFEKKHAHIDAMIGASMTWWVSSTKISITVISGAFVLRDQLHKLPPVAFWSLWVLGLIFFVSVVAFGVGLAIGSINLSRQLRTVGNMLGLEEVPVGELELKSFALPCGTAQAPLSLP